MKNALPLLARKSTIVPIRDEELALFLLMKARQNEDTKAKLTRHYFLSLVCSKKKEITPSPS